ncbi:MAG: hypothetical protein ACK5F0_12590 [Flavobacteriales bacterium]|jgi:hypothetical protein
MNINLIEGTYSLSEAQELLNKIIQVKIAYLESKISSSCNEEDIKQRENRIKSLQSQRAELNKLSAEEIRGITIQLNIDLE